MNRDLTGDRGSITGFVAIIAVALIMVVGMVYDGGQIIAAQASARSAADKAARAGAQEIDIATLRTTSETVLDPTRAETVALDFLTEVGVSGTVTVSGSSVTVTVTINQPMHILPMPDRTVVATETATALDEVAP
jgi:Flp pilus assembly protein TadG